MIKIICFYNQIKQFPVEHEKYEFNKKKKTSELIIT